MLVLREGSVHWGFQ